MKIKKINCWIVIAGGPVYTCSTRKQAREYAKKHKAGRYSYVGKVINDHRNIILEV